MGDHDEVGGKRLGWRKEARMEVGMRLLVECRRLKAKKLPNMPLKQHIFFFFLLLSVRINAY